MDKFIEKIYKYTYRNFYIKNIETMLSVSNVSRITKTKDQNSKKLQFANIGWLMAYHWHSEWLFVSREDKITLESKILRNDIYGLHCNTFVYWSEMKIINGEIVLSLQIIN